MVLGFNVSLADGSARARAKEMDIPITRDSVIYRIEDQLRKKLSELLPMERGVTEIGTARVLKVFKLHDRSGSTVAGLSVSSGTVQTGETVGFKVRRNGKDLPGAEFLRARDATLRIHKEQVRQDCQVLLCIIA
jgi:translation initiation factor IF-2